ncbi:hypothetical protein ACOSP7_020353 [Xanthoceras sorbifolium]
MKHSPVIYQQNVTSLPWNGNTFLFKDSQTIVPEICCTLVLQLLIPESLNNVVEVDSEPSHGENSEPSHGENSEPSHGENSDPQTDVAQEHANVKQDMDVDSEKEQTTGTDMLTALRNAPDSMSMSSMKDYIDPNMMDLYPHDCLFKMAMLAKQCADEDPILRPDMKQVVISLSQIPCPLWNGKQLLPGTAKYLAASSKEDSEY